MIATIFELESVHYPWRWALRCDYNADLVADLKAHIPYRQRKWIPESREWWFHNAVIVDVMLLAERYCGRVRHAERRGPSGRGPAGSPPFLPADLAAAYRTLYLTPDAPAEVIKAVYRTLSKIHHPDSGGSTSDMQRLNAAYDRLTNK